MADLNNYVVIGVKHYNELLNELFTLRQTNAYLNRENTELLAQVKAQHEEGLSVEDVEGSADED
jgi:hypothetical protein